MINKKEKVGKCVQKIYTDNDFIPLCEEYKEKKNAKEISIRENIPLQTLYYYIKKLGYNQTRRKHTLNEDYFKTINSQNKAYILGFLMADGCVCKSEEKKSKPDRLIVQISKKDIAVLEFIKKELETSYEIVTKIPSGTYAQNEMAILTINSMKLVTDLIKLGITPNKTGFESFPDINPNLKRHFLRGFLDGDGWVTRDGKSVGFISNDLMLQQIKEFLKEKINLQSEARIYQEKRNNAKVFYMCIHKLEDVRAIKHLLYHNANFYLERKHNKIIN